MSPAKFKKSHVVALTLSSSIFFLQWKGKIIEESQISRAVVLDGNNTW